MKQRTRAELESSLKSLQETNLNLYKDRNNLQEQVKVQVQLVADLKTQLQWTKQMCQQLVECLPHGRQR